MSAPPGDCVIDASAALPLFLREDLTPNAERLFAAREQDAGFRICVPDLFYAECANVLRRAERRLRVSEAVAHSSLAELLAMDLVSIPMAALIEEALRIAFRNEITTYDACYVAAAVLLQLPLVSADQRLLEKLRQGPYQGLWLGEITMAG